MNEDTITIARIKFFDRPNHCSIFEFRYSEPHYCFKTVASMQDGYGPFTLDFSNYHNTYQSIEGAIEKMLVRFRKTNFRLCGLMPIGNSSLNYDVLPSDYSDMVDELASIINFNPNQAKYHQAKTLVVDWALGKMKFSDARINSSAFELDVNKKMKMWGNQLGLNLDFYFDLNNKSM